MGFLTNKSVNFLNLHNGCAELLTQMVFIFTSIFLYQHGFSIAAVFVILGIMALGRIGTRFLALPLSRRFGLRKTVAVGLCGYGASMLMLPPLQGVDGWFLAYLALYIFFNPVYWICFHSYYTLVSEAAHRGKQYAVRNAIILSGQALFPIISAAIIKWLGYSWYFALTVPITLTALELLLCCPDVKTPEEDRSIERGGLFTTGVITSIFRSFYELGYNTLWMFVLFLFWKGKLVPLGGILTFGILVQVVWQLFIGHHYDKGQGQRIAHIGGCLAIIAITGRAFAHLSLPVIVVLEITNALATLHIDSAVDIEVYNDSQKARHLTWYWILTEMTRDVATLLGTWLIALLLYNGVGIRMVILIALPALLALWVIFIRRVRK